MYAQGVSRAPGAARGRSPASGTGGGADLWILGRAARSQVMAR